MITRNKKPPSLVRMCISVINLYLPVMAVTEFQAFGDWKVISHLVFISPKDTVRGVKGNSKEVLEICTRYGYTCQPFFSTASNSTLYGSVPYMETLPRTKGGGV